MNGVGTDETTVARVLGCFDKGAPLLALADRYRAKFNRSLAADISEAAEGVAPMSGTLKRAALQFLGVAPMSGTAPPAKVCCGCCCTRSAAARLLCF